MANTILIGTLAEFNGKSHEEWTLYKERFSEFCILNDISDDKKRALLLTTVGAETYDLIHRLVYPDKVSTKTVMQIFDLVEAYLRPMSQPFLYKHRLGNRIMKDGESTMEYIAALRGLAEQCGYQTVADIEEAVLNQFVRGVKQRNVRTKLLMEKQLTLTRAIEVATAYEAAASTTDFMGPDDRSTIPQKQYVNRNKLNEIEEHTEVLATVMDGPCGPRRESFGPYRRPYRQGWKGWTYPPYRGSNQVREKPIQTAKTQLNRCEFTPNQYLNTLRCFRCGGPHFARNCPISLNIEEPWRGPPRYEYTGNTRFQQRRRRGNLMRGRSLRPTFRQTSVPISMVETRDVLQDSSLDLEDFDATLFQVNADDNRNPPIIVPVTINKRLKQLQLDTGSQLSLLTYHDYMMLWKDESGVNTPPPLQETTLQLKAYQGVKIPVLGVISIPVVVVNQSHLIRFAVVEGNGCSLIGRNIMEQFGLLKLLEAAKYPLAKHEQVYGINKMDQQDELDAILEEYKTVFQVGLGKYTGTPINLKIRPDAVPKFFRPRPVPFALMEKVDAEITKLIQQGVFTPIKFSEWATPLVVVCKPDGGLCLCGDYRSTLNAAVQPDPYPLPRIGDLFGKMAGMTIFSKLDVKQAYQQIPLSTISAKIAAVNTHRGLMAVNRLPFGTVPSAGIFQRIIESLLADIQGVVMYQDDILIMSRDRKTHLMILRKVLYRLKLAGICLNRSKCKFLQDKVTYLGHEIGIHRVRPLPEKVQAVVNMPTPDNKSQLKSFLGLVNFYSSFTKDLATVAEPLYRLLHADQEWLWTQEHDSAFEHVKDLVVKAPILSFYDLDLPIVIVTDASHVLAHVLAHVKEDGTEHPVQFASKSLSPAERNYAQIDREAAAVIFALKKFHSYIMGRHFTLYTDHKPLLRIFGKEKPIPNIISPRMLRWAIITSSYDFSLKYRPGEEVDETCLEGNSNTLLMDLQQQDIVTAVQVKDQSRKDPILVKVMDQIQTGQVIDSKEPNLAPYRERKDELSIIDDVLYWGERIVIPLSLRERILTLLHEGHPGVVAMKLRTRAYVWWPGINRDIERWVSLCGVCQIRCPNTSQNEWVSWPKPMKPWSRIHIDFLGPIENKMILLLVDVYSGWIDVLIT